MTKEILNSAVDSSCSRTRNPQTVGGALVVGGQRIGVAQAAKTCFASRDTVPLGYRMYWTELTPAEYESSVETWWLRLK